MKKRILKTMILIIMLILIGVIVRYIYIRSKYIKIRSKYLPITMDMRKDLGLEYYIYPYDKDIEKAEIKIFKDRRSEEDIEVDSVMYKYMLDIKIEPILDKKPSDNYRYATRGEHIFIEDSFEEDEYIKFLGRKIYRHFPRKLTYDGSFGTNYYEEVSTQWNKASYYYPKYEYKYYFDIKCDYTPHIDKDGDAKLEDAQNFAKACDEMIESINWVGWDMSYKEF